MRPIATGVLTEERGLSVCLSACLLVMTISRAKNDELIEMPSGEDLGGEHWPHLANTIDRSVSGGDAAL